MDTTDGFSPMMGVPVAPDQLIGNDYEVIDDEASQFLSFLKGNDMDTFTVCADEPKALRFCHLLLRRKDGAECLFQVDFNDIKVLCRTSKDLTFCPALSADSWDKLVSRMRTALQKDCPSTVGRRIVVALALPSRIIEEAGNLYDLREQMDAEMVFPHIYQVEGDVPLTAQMVSFKKKG